KPARPYCRNLARIEFSTNPDKRQIATKQEAPIIPHIWKPAPVRRRHWNADRMKQDKRIRTTSYVASGNGYAVSRDLTPRLVLVADCKPLGRETRKHPPHQVRKLAASLNRFGF